MKSRQHVLPITRTRTGMADVTSSAQVAEMVKCSRPSHCGASLSLLVKCGFRFWNCRYFVYKSRPVHKIVLTQRNEPLHNNVIYMTSLLSLFDARSRGFVGLNDACVSCFLLS